MAKKINNVQGGNLNSVNQRLRRISEEKYKGKQYENDNNKETKNRHQTK